MLFGMVVNCPLEDGKPVDELAVMTVRVFIEDKLDVDERDEDEDDGRLEARIVIVVLEMTMIEEPELAGLEDDVDAELLLL